MMTDKLYNIYEQKIYIDIILCCYHIINDEEAVLIFDCKIDGEVQWSILGNQVMKLYYLYFFIWLALS